VLKNAFKIEGIILSLKWILTFYSKYVDGVLSIQVTAKESFLLLQKIHKHGRKFHSFSFLLDTAECLGLQCT